MTRRLLFAILMALPLRAPPLDAQQGGGESRVFHTPAYRRCLTYPSKLIDWSVDPLKRGVIFAERVDLPNRVMDALYNEDRTAAWIPTFSYEGRLGTGIGVTGFHRNLLRRKYAAHASLLYATHDNFSVRTAFLTPFYGDFPFRYGFEFQTLIREDSDEDFFVRFDPGFGRFVYGNQTVPEDRKSYLLNTVQSRLTLNMNFSRTLAAKLKALGFHDRIDPGSVAPSVPANFSAVGRELRFVGGGAGFAWDRRDDPNRPARGTLLELNGNALQGITDRDFGYAQYDAELQQFIPLGWGPHRTLLARAAIERVDRIGGRIVPFYVFPRLDQNHGLRGFDRNRFQDKGAVVFNLEYRYPIWQSWDAVLFIDHGRTFHEPREIKLLSFVRSYGVAVHFLSENDFLLLLQFGFGGGQSQIVFSLQQAF